MGYGVKTDFQQKKEFDLDKSYRYIIKPAVEAAGYTCVRSDEIQHAGNINVPMYEQLFSADLVIADLSTANLNAFFELGVRYALKPRTTIVIAESGFKIPFDMGQVIIRHYEHLGTGIDFGEVERMKGELSVACREVANANRTDSPVYTFLSTLMPPGLRAVAAAESTQTRVETNAALAQADTQAEREALTIPFAILMQAAMEARARGEFGRMRDILSGIVAAQGGKLDPFVVRQLAFATYKSETAGIAGLQEAKRILQQLDPESSGDPGVLSSWGAVHKRLFEAVDPSDATRLDYLTIAIQAYEKTFILANEVGGGINLAFLLNLRAAATSGDDAVADRVLARRVRERVLAICDDALSRPIKGESEASKAEEQYWLRATRVEALLGLGRADEAEAGMKEASVMAPASWMVKTTETQLAKLTSALRA